MWEYTHIMRCYVTCLIITQSQIYAACLGCLRSNTRITYHIYLVIFIYDQVYVLMGEKNRCRFKYF